MQKLGIYVVLVCLPSGAHLSSVLIKWHKWSLYFLKFETVNSKEKYVLSVPNIINALLSLKRLLHCTTYV